MRIYLLILSLAILATVVTSLETADDAKSSGRQERSIRDWFSGFMKRFQRKESREQPYHIRPRQHNYYSSYGTPNTYGSQYQGSHQQTYSQTGFRGAHGVGHGHGGGHGAGHGGAHNFAASAGHGASHFSGHGGGHGAGHGGGHGAGHATAHKTKAANPSGFGNVKNSDVLNHDGGNSIKESSVHSHGHGAAAVHSSQSHGSQAAVADSYEAPEVVQESYIPPAPANEGPAYVAPSNSIVPVAPPTVQYASPNALPLVQKEEDISIDGSYSSVINDQFQASSQTNYQPNYFPNPAAGRSSDSQVVLGSNSGDSVFAPTQGPYDPIIEIVFQEGEPAPPHPPPIIDESLFEPVSDDVEVFFIEYSPEDNLDDLKNLDLSGAQPAILQDLPNELPYELRNHLLNSGVLNNAHIEILDLDRALHDQSLDVNTRNALRQAYSRTNRQAPSNSVQKKKDQAVDIRVQRMNHDSSTPEGIVEFLSGLKTFRKGTFAGVVEVNDENTDSYLPVTIDGDKLPLPENILPLNRKLDGVLVLAPELDGNIRDSKSSFSQGKSLQASPSDPQPTVIKNKQRRLLDIDWADMDTNGWIPIVDVET